MGPEPDYLEDDHQQDVDLNRDLSSPELFEDHLNDSNFKDATDTDTVEKSVVEQILCSVRGLVKSSGRSDDQDLDSCLLEGSSINDEDQLLQQVCHKIGLLRSKEFNDLEEQLFLFLVEEWMLNCCFRALEFVVDIFRYICTVVPTIDIVQDYLIHFSQPFMPPHIRLCLFPAVVDIANKRFPGRFQQQQVTDNFLAGVEKYQVFATHNEKSAGKGASVSSAAEFMAFWIGSFKYYLTAESSEFEKKLLTGFSCCRSKVTEVCMEDEHRMTMLKVLVKCLLVKPNRTTLLLSSLFMVFLQSLEFTPKTWAGMKFLIGKLKAAVSHFKSDEAIFSFVSSAISSFLQCVDVNNQNLIHEFASSSTPVHSSMNPSSDIKTNDKVHQIPPAVAAKHNSVSASSQSVEDSGYFGTVSTSVSQDKENHELPVPSSSPQIQNRISTNSSLIGIATKFGNSTTAPASEKTLDLLEKLVKKMKASKVNLCLESDKDKLRSLIRDLNTFL